MINEALVESLALHAVGNRMNDEPLTLAKAPVNIDDEIVTVLSSFFIIPFKTDRYFNFDHQDGFENNEVFKAVAAIFDNPENLYESSVKLAERLFDVTDSVKIRGGEFYVAYFSECTVDGEETEAVGLFKSESRETFLKIYPTSGNFILEKEEGISLRKIDKGCMIFNVDRDRGFLAAVADGIRSGDEKYWCDDFLQIKSFDNNYSKTQAAMKVCKDFVSERLPEEFELSKADQIDILNRGMNYFKSHEVFDKPEFEQEVFRQPEVIESFRDFDSGDIPMDMSFEIAPDAVKKQSKIFKSVLKLDKNFHIYIHGDRSMIERGEDNGGKKYYKIFYEQES
ncbi:MAG: nucleoid-associated protein [Prevotellaceae bacterium]|jgi:hypothetical protein|nr:nucleoid-associated protein [Prevotellaceae bacterium]